MCIYTSPNLNTAIGFHRLILIHSLQMNHKSKTFTKVLTVVVWSGTTYTLLSHDEFGRFHAHAGQAALEVHCRGWTAHSIIDHSCSHNLGLGPVWKIVLITTFTATKFIIYSYKKFPSSAVSINPKGKTCQLCDIKNNVLYLYKQTYGQTNQSSLLSINASSIYGRKFLLN